MRRIIVLLAFAVAASAAENPDLLVTTSWLQQHLRDRQITIIDVGDRTSYEAAHIPGARFLALNDVVVGRNGIPNEVPDPAALEQTLRRAGIPNRGRIILYARDPIAAARVFFTLDYAGRGDDVALLDGGFKKWTSEQRNTQTGPPRDVNVAAFVVRPHPETIVRLTAMRMIAGCAASMPGNVAIVDARSPDEYIGAVAGASIRNPGHIDYAINIPWTRTSPEARRRSSFRSPICARSIAAPASRMMRASSPTAAPACRPASTTSSSATSAATYTSTTARTSSGARCRSPRRHVDVPSEMSSGVDSHVPRAFKKPPDLNENGQASPPGPFLCPAA